jgi:hypothetical protein
LIKGLVNKELEMMLKKVAGRTEENKENINYGRK